MTESIDVSSAPPAAEPAAAPTAAPGAPTADADRPPAPAAGAGTPRRWIRVLLLTVLVLVALAAAAAGGWFWWQSRNALQERFAQQTQSIEQLRTQLAALELRTSELSAQQGDLSRLAGRNRGEVASLQAQTADAIKLMSRVSEDVAGGRTRFRLVAIEQLLLLAGDRLQLAHDVRAALTALDAADSRLAALSDPQLFPVREALARERAALAAVALPDLTSAALSLSSLVERAPRLPLAAQAPTRFRAPEARSSAGMQDAATPWQRLLQAVRTAVSGLFTLRHDDSARNLRLLPPDTEAVVYAVLTLKLEAARVALLSRDTVAMREALHSADAWLDAQFKPGDPAVVAAKAEIARLGALELDPPLPEFGASLTALRKRLDADLPAAGSEQPAP